MRKGPPAGGPFRFWSVHIECLHRREKRAPVFKLEIRTGNAAFEGNAKADEIARILLSVSDRLLKEADALNKVQSLDGLIRDVNGNTVGRWQYSE